MTIYGSETQMEGWYTDAKERSNETPSVEYKEAEADAEEIKVLDANFLCSFDDLMTDIEYGGQWEFTWIIEQDDLLLNSHQPHTEIATQLFAV